MWLLCPSPCFYYKGETSWPTSTAQQREDLVSQQPASQLPLVSIGCLAQLHSVWYSLSPSYNWYPFLLFTWSDSCPDLCVAGSFLSFCSWLNVTSSKSCFSLCYIEVAPQSHSVIFPHFIYVIFLATEYIFIIGWCVHSCSPLSPVEWKLYQGMVHGGIAHCIPQCLECSRHSVDTWGKGDFSVCLRDLEQASWPLWTLDPSLRTWR